MVLVVKNPPANAGDIRDTGHHGSHSLVLEIHVHKSAKAYEKKHFSGAMPSSEQGTRKAFTETVALESG